MKTIEASYRITTPMFLGDADQKASEMRPPTVKGAMRFWWRALYWSHFLAQAGGDIAKGLHALHAAEGKLFGTASGNDGATQGRFLLHCDFNGKTDVQPPQASQGHIYLLGQGVYSFKSGYARTAIAAGGTLRVRLAFRPKTDPALIRQAEQALLLLGLLGGLGSRARKGFGSLALHSLTGGEWQAPKDATQLRDTLQRLLTNLTPDLPPFTAFSGHTRLDLSQGGADAWQLLGDMGAEQQFYRSWGQNGKVAGKPAEQNFKDDHDLALMAVNGQCPDRLPDRAVFGLPHPYFFSSVKPASDAKLAVDASGSGRNRRASPLLAHIHQFPDGACLAVNTLLPAQFLPDGDRVRLKAKNLRGQCMLPAKPDWQVIHRYLDRFDNKETLLP